MQVMLLYIYPLLIGIKVKISKLPKKKKQEKRNKVKLSKDLDIIDTNIQSAKTLAYSLSPTKTQWNTSTKVALRIIKI